MGIYQRNLTSYEEKAIIENSQTDHNCMNCHSFPMQNPDKMVLHMRAVHGGTYVIDGSEIEKLEGKVDDEIPSLVYPSWHPSGEFVAFCDGDDYWSNPQKLQMQVDHLRQHPECVAVSTDVDNINEQGRVIGRNVYQNNPPLTGSVQYDMWTGGKSIATWSSYLFRRTAFDKIPLQGFIDHDFPFQDWPATVIMAAYGEFHFLPISTVAYRVVEGSDSNGVDIQKVARRQRRTFQMNQYLASLFPDTLPMDDEETYWRYLAGTLVAPCVLCNEYQLAKMYARQNHNWKKLRNWCCQTWITFQIWRMAKLIRRRINKLK